MDETSRLLARFGRTFAAGEVLFREGETGGTAFLLQEGRARLIKKVRGVERSLVVLRPGDLFGESALVPGVPRSSTAIALSAGVALALEPMTLQQLLETNPSLAARLVQQLVRRLRDAEDQIEITMLRDAQSKIVSAVIKSAQQAQASGTVRPDGTVRIALSPMELSSRVGLDVDAVKRGVQRLRDAQYVRIIDEHIEVLDLDALRRLYTLLGTKDEIRGAEPDDAGPTKLPRGNCAAAVSARLGCTFRAVLHCSEHLNKVPIDGPDRLRYSVWSLGNSDPSPMTPMSWFHHAHALLLPVAVMTLSAGMSACSGRSNTPGAQDPSRQSQAEHDLGVDALIKGNLREALAHAKKAVELDDENYDAQLLAATVYIGFCTYSPDECRLADAEKHARAALKAKPTFRQARNTLGSVLINEKRYDEAITTLKPLTEDMEYSTPEVAWGNLGWAYLEKGDLDSAVISLKRAVAVQPAFCWGWEKLGLAYEKKKDLNLAEKSFTAAVEVDLPQCKAFADAFEDRARVRQKLGTEGSRADLEQCAKAGAGTPAGKRCAASLGQSPGAHP
jgi:CRP-like cAMP-binding protein/Tfp pilus assembly protein PilF